MRMAAAGLLVLALGACATPAARGPSPAAARSVPPPAASPVTGFQPPAALHICPGMRVSHAPETDAARRILVYRRSVSVNGVPLMVSPVEEVCLSRGQGGRHEGLDLAPFPRTHVRMVRAGGDGVVREFGERHDFGIYVLIDHGNGVYTRYAHLAFASPGIAAGRRVAAGEPIGQMGGTGGVPIHLHYAILTGDYHTPARSFGLTPVDPFEVIARGARTG